MNSFIFYRCNPFEFECNLVPRQTGRQTNAYVKAQLERKTKDKPNALWRLMKSKMCEWVAIQQLFSLRRTCLNYPNEAE